MIKWLIRFLGAEGEKVGTLSVPKVVVAPPLPANKTIVYRLTDPGATLVLTKQEDLTEQVAPFFQVLGFAGGGFDLQTPQGQAASLYMNIDKAIKNYQTFAEKPIDHWAAIAVLSVLPRAGRRINAYYNRRTLSFFFDIDRASNTEIFAADSPDVTIHELGHAILDSKRPEFWNTPILEIAALHEGWGDMFTIVSQLQHVEVAKAVIDFTKGNLRIDNVVSELAEQLGKAIYDDSHPRGSNQNWLRNALNNFNYIDPKTLPTEAPMDQICAEPHSFSRILTGTVYDLMVVIYETEISVGKDSLTALLDAAKGLGWYLDRTFTRIPSTTTAFYAFANTLLQVDRELSNSYYQQKFLTVLQKRQLIPAGVTMLKMKDPAKLIKVKLCDHAFDSNVVALAANPLYNVEIEIPDEGATAILAAKQFIDYLYKNNHVSSSPHTPFEVLDGKLIRDHFDSIEDYFPNWANPTQPEFWRPPKPRNNFLACGCREQLEKPKENELPRRVVRESRIRYRDKN